MATPLVYDIPTGDTLTRPFSAADDIFQSGAIQSGDIGADVIQSVNIASGQVTSGKIGNEAVSSGNIASGSIGSVHLADNAVQSGDIDANAVSSGNIASGTIGSVHLADEAVQSGDIAVAAVSSGNIASGTIGSVHLADNAVLSGDIGPNAVHSGNIASGVIGEHHLRSGFSVTQAQILIDNTWITAEPISGGRCVAFNTSGQLIQAKADDDTRLPSVGVIDANYASGVAASFIHKGRMTSPFFDFSGHIGGRLFVGVSGELTYTPPQIAGQRVQKIAMASTQSGAFVAPDLDVIKLNS